MAKRKNRKVNPSLPRWVVSVFVAIALVLSVLTFGGDLAGMDTSFLQSCMDAIDRLLYGGPTSPAPSLPASGQAKVYIIDVGQGESILITTEERSMLIDAGENDKGDEVLAFLDTLGLDSLDYALATHPDSDHIGGLDAVIDTTLNLPKIPGGKKLIYTHVSMPLTALDDMEELGRTDPMMAELAKIVARHNGLWSPEAEKYLLANAKKIDE